MLDRRTRDQVRDSLEARIRLTPKGAEKPIDPKWRIRSMNRRFAFAATVLLVMLLAAWLRAFQLAFYPDSRMKNLGKAQYQSVIELTPHRGAIYDRNYRELAVSIYVDSLYARPREIRKPEALARKLSGLLRVPYRTLLEKLKSKKNFVWIKRWCEPGLTKKITLWKVDGLDFLKESKRYYPNRQLAANLIGFVGLDAEGLEGIELQYDEFLKRPAKTLLVDRDGLGKNLLRETPDVESGWSVVLTIDGRLQNAVENALGEAVQKHSAKGGLAVAMDPMTGEIFALANHPSFNPNRFVDSAVDHFRNRVVTDAFEPGSLIKVFLASTAMETRKFNPQDLVFCENGRLQVGRNTIRESNYRQFGWLPLKDIIRLSSNIGSAKIASQVGREDYGKFLRALGFGEITGIDLPGEVRGIFRDPKSWRDIDLANIGFGQGISVTPIQLVSALAKIANGGRKVVPHLLYRRVRDEETVLFPAPDAGVRPIFSASTIKKIKGIMRSVIEPGGTGTLAALPGVEVAGKTGTAQKVEPNAAGVMTYSDSKFIMSFFGFFPVDRPRMVILVMLDEPKMPASGGTAAGPVFKNIATAAIQFGYLETPTEVAKVHPGAKSTQIPTVPVRSALNVDAEEEMHAKLLEGIDEILKMGATDSLDFRGLSLQSVLRLSRQYQLPIVVSGRGYVTGQEIQKSTDGKVKEIELILEPKVQ